MSANDLYVIGAGGQAREILDVLRWSDPLSELWRFIGFVADEEPNAYQLAKAPATWLGSIDSFVAATPEGAYVVGIGDGTARARVAERLAQLPTLVAATLIHPTATVGHGCSIGSGSVLWAHSAITIDVEVGRNVHINQNCTVGHDSVLGDCVTLNPGATVSGDVRLGAGSTIGANACVLQGLRIGEGTTIGAGAVVTRDLPAGVVAVGVPARVRES